MLGMGSHSRDLGMNSHSFLFKCNNFLIQQAGMVLYSFVKAFIRKAYFGSKFKYLTTIQMGIVLVLCSNIQSSILSWIQNPSNWMLKEVSTNGEEMSITYGKFCFTCENVSTNLILRTLSTLKQLICKYIVQGQRKVFLSADSH